MCSVCMCLCVIVLLPNACVYACYLLMILLTLCMEYVRF